MTGKAHDRGLIDTNVFIHLPALKASALPEAMVISSASCRPASTTPSDPAEKAPRTSLLQHTEATFNPLPYETESARAFGQICAAVIAAGRKPRGRVADLMIAATAVVHRLPLYTTNPGDFAGLDDLITVVAVPRPPFGQPVR